MLKKYRKVIGFVLFVAVIAALFAVLGGGTQRFGEKYEGVDLSTDVTGLGRVPAGP